MKHQSINSNEGISDLFQAMFPDSEIAKKFACGKDKTGYIVRFGLAPYFKEQLVNSINKAGPFVLMFDESLNQATKKKQMDVHIRYWDDGCVWARYLGSQFLGHGRAEDLLHHIKHLDTAGTYARILFVVFSSAFNTIIPALLQDKLSQLHVPVSTCRWITDFLSDRKQHVRLGKHLSDSRTISIGSPQGCVLSPLLFSLYTNSCTSSHQSVKLLKFRRHHPHRTHLWWGRVCLQV
ncbi:uncharacterized protein LOC117561737 [Gymnodraco acuticeps]|uniref:Uncharacterized protein LOC117561737 n=1 Tax=Gymnodraco acuticeps TaxID=8218 RepID=A0A6P8WDJ1_GYMAC|nr:uncharacterized protein LOC117561737 [Gymnodraco acuticeps]XP_034095205.1 uncharacterized protein LOC117561737 [Gymnodraco acuticeps]